MPRFRPFAGLRYDRSVPLDKVIAPPYDVVGPEERARLAHRHTANAIHVELPVQDAHAGLDKYRSAARIFSTWRDEGLLVPDAPAFYAYRMTVPGGGSTTGVIGALGCEAPGGDILPHEQTIPKDKSDRLELLRACRANLSPIWGLSLSQGLAAVYEPEGAPGGEAVDDDGVTHALWVLDAPEVVEAVTSAVESAPVVIADGHHRYETALTYQAERRAAARRRSRRLRPGHGARGRAGRRAAVGGRHPPDRHRAFPPTSTSRSCSAAGSTSCTPGRPTTTSWGRCREPWPSSPPTTCGC